MCCAKAIELDSVSWAVSGGKKSANILNRFLHTLYPLTLSDAPYHTPYENHLRNFQEGIYEDFAKTPFQSSRSSTDFEAVNACSSDTPGKLLGVKFCQNFIVP
jgi:hypothetical protein